MPGKDASEQEYWKREWEKHQNDKAVVDVNVRGWIYTPHRGQNTRRQRLVIGVARQLAGVPAPPAAKSSESLQSSQVPSRASSPTRLTAQEEDLINLEAENIVKRGEAEERNATRGIYSEMPSRGADTDSVYGDDSRGPSPDRRIRHRLSQVSNMSSQEDEMITPLQKRTSWSHPSKMSPAELVVANRHLLNRIKPFMHNPLINSPITAFFYNDQDSRQHTVYTDGYGHFHCRAALDFVPTHVRVLAGENLSATEEIVITSTQGVSLISDIDDTVKHSGIGAGITEIFRNAFIRDMSDLTIEGVREWYNTLHDMGVGIHYVSNSPWQMYPALTSYFKLARLPKGSFHLKQYTGMLNGIFEPVAERKKSSLDKIMRDFPERKFILVGDSGEADLEVYTDVALDNPDRILGIFIRDVTTSAKPGYFDSSMGPSGSAKHSRNHSRHRSGDSLAMSKRLSRPEDIQNDDGDLKAALAASLADMEAETRNARRSINPDAPALVKFDGASDRRFDPDLRRRAQMERIELERSMTASPEEDLIDFSEEPAPSKPWLQAPPRRRKEHAANARGVTAGQRPTPSPPPKPRALRSPSPSAKRKPSQDSQSKPAPPRPRKPSSTVRPPSPHLLQQIDGPQTPSAQQPQPAPQLQTHQPSPLSQVSRQDSPIAARARPPLPTRPKTVQKIANVAGSYWYGQPAAGQPGLPTSSGSYAEKPRQMSTASTKSMDEMRVNGSTPKTAPPPPPPRRNMSSVPFAASARKASNRLSGGFDVDSPLGSPGEPNMSTKERLWRQRWARAQSLLEPKGVTLRSWKVGSDVADVAVKLAEMEMRRIERENRRGVSR